MQLPILNHERNENDVELWIEDSVKSTLTI